MIHIGFLVWIILQTIWAIFICVYIRYKITHDTKYIFQWANKEVDLKQKPYQRKEANNWPMFEIYIGASFLMPYRLFYFLGAFLLNAVFLNLVCAFTMKMNKEYNFRRPIIRFLLYIFARSTLFICCGIYKLETTKLKIKDHEKDYPDYSSKPETYPMIISNHVSWMDPFILYSLEAPSMAAKKQLGDLPLIGLFTKAIQALLIDRAEGTKKAVENINERCSQIMEGKKLAPLMVFPEGTTTNGHYVISFKKGPFLPKKPIKMFALKFYSDRFNPFLDEIGDGLLVMLTMSRFRNRIKIFEYDTYYPDHLEVDGDIEWQTYADKTRALIIQALKEFGVQDVTAGFADQINYREKQGLKITEAEKNQQRHSIMIRKKMEEEVKKKSEITTESQISQRTQDTTDLENNNTLAQELITK